MEFLTSDDLVGAQATWDVWSTYAVLVIADPQLLPAARIITDEVTDAVGAAASRFRPDSELARLNTAAGRPIQASTLFLDLLRTGIKVAEATGGLVDPLVGNALVEFGYDRDIAEVRARGVRPGPRISVTTRHTWRDLHLGADATVQVPAGAVVDLGASAKAWAADTAAARIFRETGAPVLVGIGGDMAVAGVPDGNPGFVVRIVEHPSEPGGPLLALPQGGLATSSTMVRRWQAGRRELHHVIDPRTAAPAKEFWRTVSVVGNTCVDANAASTAALILGDGAAEWLRRQGIPARLVAVDGSVTRVAPWPKEV